MKLHYQTYPESLDTASLDVVPILIIPGLFGSITNWRSFAKKLSDHVPVIIIDQRNHGRSPHADTQSYFDMQQDLLELLDDLSIEKVILCGHSMGGKVAMVFSLLQAERVHKLAILDIAPVKYTHSHAPFLDALLEIDLSQLASRGAADRALQSAIPDVGTRLFLLQSLIGTANNYEWRLNLPVLHKEMDKLVGFPKDELAGMVNNLDTCLIYGEKSSYVSNNHLNKIKDFFPNSEFISIPNAGHWLHVEQPVLVLDALITFLQKK